MTQKGSPLLATYIAAIISIILWGFSFLWTNQLIHNEIPIFTFIFVRLLIAGILLLILAKITGKLQKIETTDFKWMFLMALCEPFLYFIGESFGMKSTGSAIITAVIISIIPIVCLVYERFFTNKKMGYIKVGGIIITIPGIIMVVADGEKISLEHFYGLALLFLAVFAAVGFSVFAKRLTSKYNSLTIATYQFLIGSVLFFPTFLYKGIEGLNQKFFTAEVIIPILTLAILCSCLCFVLWIGVIKRIGITRTNTFSARIPAVSASGAALLGEETLSLIRILGIAIVIIGVIMVQRD